MKKYGYKEGQGELCVCLFVCLFDCRSVEVYCISDSTGLVSLFLLGDVCMPALLPFFQCGSMCYNIGLGVYICAYVFECFIVCWKFFGWQFVCLFVSCFFGLFVYLSVCWSVCLSVCLFICLYVCLFVFFVFS